MEFEPVIGLEIHAQLATKSKLFCRCAVATDSPPNHNTCPVCLGLPGALPTVNQRAIEFAIMLGLATNCEIRLDSEFARKNYFYPDLPKAYQTSQYDKPICENGFLEIEMNGEIKKIGITRIHLEEDAGKLTHEGADANASYVDLNRAGTPLVEIVSEPDIRSAAEAKIYVQKIHSLVTALDICWGNMERGNLRCDANISLRLRGEKKFGTRTETKNLNSFRFIQQAIEYEINRQSDLLLDGEKIQQETRLYNPALKKTFTMRKKEEADDYRYFPCPDLSTIKLEKDWIEQIQTSLPELPDQKIERYQKDYELNSKDAAVITLGGFTKFFEEGIALKSEKQQKEVSKNFPKVLANWIMGDISKYINEEKKELMETKLTPQKICQLVELIESGEISNKIAKTLLPFLAKTDSSPQELVKEKGLTQLSDTKMITDWCQQVVDANPAEVQKYKSGKDKVFGFFVGQVMQQSKGKANPQLVTNKLHELLK